MRHQYSAVAYTNISEYATMPKLLGMPSTPECAMPKLLGMPSTSEYALPELQNSGTPRTAEYDIRCAQITNYILKYIFMGTPEYHTVVHHA